VKASIIKIGNSHGIRIPKPIIDACNFGQEVELEVQNHQLIIRTPHHPRQNWADAFQKMAASGDDQLLETADPEWDHEQWQW
jgi:antitoxin MazE